MLLESLNNYLGVKSRKKTIKNLVFSTFDCDPEIILERLEHDSNPH